MQFNPIDFVEQFFIGHIQAKFELESPLEAYQIIFSIKQEISQLGTSKKKFERILNHIKDFQDPTDGTKTVLAEVQPSSYYDLLEGVIHENSFNFYVFGYILAKSSGYKDIIYDMQWKILRRGLREGAYDSEICYVNFLSKDFIQASKVEFINELESLEKEKKEAKIALKKQQTEPEEQKVNSKQANLQLDLQEKKQKNVKLTGEKLDNEEEEEKLEEGEIKLEKRSRKENEKREEKSQNAEIPLTHSKLYQPYQTCDICAEEYYVEFESVTSEVCGHAYHYDCILNHIKVAIKEQRYPIQCLLCTEELSYTFCEMIISQSMNIKDLEALQKLSVAKYQLDHAGELMHCLTPDCKFFFISYPNMNYFSCPACRKEYCINCEQPWHENLACKENLDMMSPEQIQFAEACKKYGYKSCPQCKQQIEKDFGCNHIICRCGTDFCFKCGKTLMQCHCKSTF